MGASGSVVDHEAPPAGVPQRVVLHLLQEFQRHSMIWAIAVTPEDIDQHTTCYRREQLWLERRDSLCRQGCAGDGEVALRRVEPLREERTMHLRGGEQVPR